MSNFTIHTSPMRYPWYALVILTVLIGCDQLSGQYFLQHRKKVVLSKWQFFQGDVHLAESGDPISMQGWEEVTVPHTWNAEDVLTRGRYYRQGIGWYRTTFEVPAEDLSKRIFIRFEGVSLVADVFINGRYLGTHKGGYSAFCYELTPHLRKNGLNYLSVKVDNSMQPDVAPSGTHLYPLFGGIYRPVTLFVTNQACIYPLDNASSGVYIHPVTVSKENASVEVVTLIDYQTIPVLTTNSEELLPPEGTEGKGLLGAYYQNSEFQGMPGKIQVDREIAFQYGEDGPFDNVRDNFSMIWTGRFAPHKSGLYRFMLNSDDGSRLFLGDERVIDHWGDHAAFEKWGEVRLKAGKEIPLKILYYESGGIASVLFGWRFIEEKPLPVKLLQKIEVIDSDGQLITSDNKNIMVKQNSTFKSKQKIDIQNPRLWDARRDPCLYTVRIRLEDKTGKLLDAVEQPLGLRTFSVNPDSGMILNGKRYPLYGVCRHQEREGLGPALSNQHHKQDMDFILELGANGVRLAHYQQADTMYSMCDANGLVVWAEIPNTPAWRGENPAYLDNCRDQLIELIKQNYNHPSILFWGMYNEIPIADSVLQNLHETAKSLDPARLTTQADFTQVTERHFITDVAAWNWYFGWYYGEFDQYTEWFDRLHRDHPGLTCGISEYGAGGSISQQQDPPERPDPNNGRFFPEQYQRVYHEAVWKRIKDRKDLWCKFIWNMFDFSWTNVHRGDRPYINHKGLMTHDRKVKKDAFYFYKTNWSDEPVLYLLNRRLKERTETKTTVSVYTNLDSVTLYINDQLVSKKAMMSDIHKMLWEGVQLMPGSNKIHVTGEKNGQTFEDNCVWTVVE